MKRLSYLWVLFILPHLSHSQEFKEQKVTSKINAATVFFNSAQVYRTAEVTLTEGEQMLRFEQLSPYIRQKSIQFQLPNVSILSINFEKNYADTIKPSKEESTLLDQLHRIEKSLEEQAISLWVVKEQIEFLKSNRRINGNQNLSVNALKETAAFFNAQMKQLKTKETKLKKELEQSKAKKNNVERKLKDITGKKNRSFGEIVVKVNAKKAQQVEIAFNYTVDNVSWYPSYDIRVRDLNSPLEIVYKANLKQNSQVDWKNVKLRFSSANPDGSNQLGELIPYYINYGTRPPIYRKRIESVSGYVTDGRTPLAGVNVSVKGTSIATTTNLNGKYNLQIPRDAKELEFHAQGYQRQVRFISNGIMNVNLQEERSAHQESVVVGYDATQKRIQPALAKMAAYEDQASVIETEVNIYQTSFELEVVKPYTVSSSNKDFVIAMASYLNEADYTYFSIPKIDEAAFLTAKFQDWENMNLLSGEANVYLENTFIGTTLIDPRTANKELQIALGKDKNVVIERSKSKEYSSEQFIGTKKEQVYRWDIQVKNNKTVDINIIIADQIPVSTQEDIKITLDKSFNGSLDEKTGEVHWKRTITGGSSENIKLQFSIKYPKDKRLYVD